MRLALGVIGVLVTMLVCAFLVDRYSNRFEQELEAESRGKHRLISELVTTLAALEQDIRAAGSRMGDDQLVPIVATLDKAEGLLRSRIGEHDFAEDDDYTRALAIAAPAIDDVSEWMRRGIAGLEPYEPTVLRIASQRVYLVKVQLQKAENAANARTLMLMQKLSKQLKTFGNTVKALIAGLAFLLLMLMGYAERTQRTRLRLWHERKLTSESINNINEGFVLTDEHGKVLVVNRTLPELCAPLAGALEHMPFDTAVQQTLDAGALTLAPADTLDETHAGEQHTAAQERQELITSSGRYLRMTNRATTDGGRVITLTDITDLKQTQEKLHLQANYDYLTSIANRSYYVTRLQEALAAARRHDHKVALMQFDLDKFKQVNDTLGHDAGDELLIETAQRIKRNLRENDLAARIGGDEFAAILTAVQDESEVISSADRIIKELRQELHINGAQIDFSASIGIAIFPDHANDLESLIKHADIACYRAKDSGRNNYKIYGADMRVQAMEAMTLETKLRKAVELDELYLNYQPQLLLDDDRINMVEAFSRWHDSALGDVTPDRFIPVADKNGLIATLGEQVLEKSFAQLRDWDNQGVSDITIAVNISRRQLYLPTLPEIIDKFSEQYEVAPERLALEITENIIADDWQEAAEKLSVLADRGIGIIVDDYGSGTSSLMRIKELPIKALKIDGQFTRRLCEDSATLDIVSAIVSSAVTLRIDTIAENVETSEQVELLRSIGCTAIQGYYVGAPQTATDFVSTYKANLHKRHLKKVG